MVRNYEGGGYVRLFCQNIQNKGPTYLKEGLCTSDRAYVVQRGPTNVL